MASGLLRTGPVAGTAGGLLKDPAPGSLCLGFCMWNVARVLPTRGWTGRGPEFRAQHEPWCSVTWKVCPLLIG